VCVSLSVLRYNNNALHLKLVGKRGQCKKERKKKEIPLSIKLDIPLPSS